MMGDQRLFRIREVAVVDELHCSLRWNVITKVHDTSTVLSRQFLKKRHLFHATTVIDVPKACSGGTGLPT